MFEQDKSPEAVLARPMPPRYRLASALLRRIGIAGDGTRGTSRVSAQPHAKRDAERAKRKKRPERERVEDDLKNRTHQWSPYPK